MWKKPLCVVDVRAVPWLWLSGTRDPAAGNLEPLRGFTAEQAAAVSAGTGTGCGSDLLPSFSKGPGTASSCGFGRVSSSSLQGFPRRQYLVTSTGWALSTGLAVAVITLGLRVWQLQDLGQCYATLNTSATDTENWENGCRGCLERFRLQLKAALCNAPEMDGRGCLLCPRDWLQHGNWCYWVSHESRDWQRSRDDCAQKGSALFIIRNQEQMHVLQDVTQGRGYVWIGLAVTGAKGTWTWLDGSMLDTKQFRILGSATSGSCALMKGSQIHSEGCNAESRWVCEKDAVSL